MNDWQPGNVGFLSVEDMAARSIAGSSIRSPMTNCTARIMAHCQGSSNVPFEKNPSVHRASFGSRDSRGPSAGERASSARAMRPQSARVHGKFLASFFPPEIAPLAPAVTTLLLSSVYA